MALSADPSARAPERSVLALIPSWNGSADTAELLQSLVAQSSESCRIDVVVVDNASSPEDLQTLERAIAALSEALAITLVRNQSNRGVPAAYNQAIAAAGRQYEYFLRLDNDVVLLSGAVQALCDALEEQRAGGVRLVGGEVRYYDHPETRNGGAVSFDLVRGRSRIGFPDRDVVCDGVLGCVMLLDREVVQALRPEVFLSWLYLTTDESELSLRARQNGWTTYYLARPVALHKGGRSTARVRAVCTLHNQRNWAYLAIVYAPSWPTRILIALRIALTAAMKLLTLHAAQARWLLAGLVAGFVRHPGSSRRRGPG